MDKQIEEFSIELDDSGTESLLRDPDTSLCDSTQAEDKDESIHFSHTFGSSSSLSEEKTHHADDKSPLRPKSPGGCFDPHDFLEKYVGIVTLPNQVQQKAVKKGFVFNLMVVGESGLGKSTLVNSLFLTNLYMDRCVPDVSEKIAQTVSITKSTVDIVEDGVNLRLTVIDTPGFGDALNNHESWKAAVRYVDQEMEKYRRNEIGLNRKNITDSRVHCCLYFISPHGHGLKPIDVNFMKALDQKVNIVPVLAKADSLTPKETRNMKAKILNEIDKFKIKIFQVPGCDPDSEDVFKQQTLELKRSIPFAFIGSNTVVERNGRRVRARVYPWGIVEVVKKLWFLRKTFQDFSPYNGLHLCPDFELPKCSLNAASKDSKRSQPRKKNLINEDHYMEKNPEMLSSKNIISARLKTERHEHLG